MLTIAACLIALVIAWFALHLLTQIAVGFLVSPRVSGRAILRQKLMEYGTDATRIPEAAYDELGTSWWRPPTPKAPTLGLWSSEKPPARR